MAAKKYKNLKNIILKRNPKYVKKGGSKMLVCKSERALNLNILT